MFASVILYCHLGLGDHFICNGLVYHFASQFQEIVLPCWRRNYTTVQSLYSQAPNITVLPIDTEPQDIEIYARTHNLAIIPVGFEYIHQFISTTGGAWHDAFYAQYNIPLEYKYTKFLAPHTANADLVYDRVVKEPDYVLVHNGSSESTGYPIDILQGRRASEVKNLVKITPDITDNLLDWVSVMQGAREIHAVNSSIFWLVDSLPDIKADLYYHDIRNALPLRPSSKWKFINYKHKV
jgi:hypothetical protein